MSRILIVEDDRSLATALSEGLQYEGHVTLLARDGAAGLRLAGQGGIDLVILDVMLPEVNGVDVCRRLRSRGSTIPIVMLTSKSQELDKVVGLKAGADDYITKPFSFMELLARVEAVLRRSRRFAEQAHTYAFGDVTLNFRTREVTKGERLLALQPREFRLLEYFIEHRGEVVGRDQLLDSVWGHGAVSPLTRTVDMHIAKLRQKIEDDSSDPRWIVTVHRVGYRFTG
ncbi:MAG: response regulator transcription factor [Acidobacteria bacterium]|nr:response regulator transcription factor [Acidobacteriota bacterium]